MKYEKTLEIIRNYYASEFEEVNEESFNDLENVGLAYTTTEDDKHGIQVSLNIPAMRLELRIDNEITETLQFDSIDEMNRMLEWSSFDSLVSDWNWTMQYNEQLYYEQYMKSQNEQ